jgi:hypothetical protein
MSERKGAFSDLTCITLTHMSAGNATIPGVTKGKRYRLVYRLCRDSQVIQTLYSSTFLLWSNLSQQGFPRSEYDKSKHGKTREQKRRDEDNDLLVRRRAQTLLRRSGGVGPDATR